MAKSRKDLVYRRRLLVKRIYLKGTVSSVDIAQHPEMIKVFGEVSDQTIRTDLKEISKWYLKTVQNNPHILEKQAEYILRHLDELKLIKEKLWELESTASEKNRVAALKTLISELSHEARVLKLIDITKTINNYIHIDKIKVLTANVIDVIKDFVPEDQQKYALERLKNIGSDIVDADCTDVEEVEEEIEEGEDT